MKLPDLHTTIRYVLLWHNLYYQTFRISTKLFAILISTVQVEPRFTDTRLLLQTNYHLILGCVDMVGSNQFTSLQGTHERDYARSRTGAIDIISKMPGQVAQRCGWRNNNASNGMCNNTLFNFLRGRLTF